MVLTLLILIPIVGGILAWDAGAIGARASRWVALATCVTDLGVAAWLWLRFQPSLLGQSFFIEQKARWIPQLGVSYHLAMDGLSLILIVLTALLGIVAVAASWTQITKSVGLFHLALLAVLTGVTGVFLARDLLLFYFFWELMLVPMYFLISIWGHEKRVYASIKFFIFTFVSSLFMLAGILGLVFLHERATSILTFDAGALAATPLSQAAGMWLMLAFFAAFAVKLPAVPFHTWLADAHTQAPTGGSILLAGLLLKTGAYGMLRFAVPLFPQASAAFAPIAGLLGVIGIVYGGALAFAQDDLKRMVAYSSISHMGFVLLGIYAGGQIAVEGAVVQIVAHGLSTPALFLLAGSIEERTGTRDLSRLGGLWETAPRFGGFILFFVLAALGLPGMANFVGEFLVLIGAYRFLPALGVAGSVGFVVSVIYGLRLVQESVHGPNRNGWRIADLNMREAVTLGVLAAAIVVVGLVPGPVLRTTRNSLAPVERVLTGHGRLASVGGQGGGK